MAPATGATSNSGCGLLGRSDNESLALVRGCSETVSVVPPCIEIAHSPLGSVAFFVPPGIVRRKSSRAN
jgi:hypothetical protein